MLHGGLVLETLLLYTINLALGYNSDCVFINVTCSTGIIPNNITFVHHTISYSVKIILQYLEIATIAALSLICYNSESVVAKFFNGIICDAKIMGPVIDYDNLWIWFNNFDHCMQNIHILLR